MILLFLSIPILLASFLVDETVSGYGGSEQVWQLVEINGDEFRATATLEFGRNGRVTGQGPCNTYSATQTVPYPWFELDQIASTKMACADLAAETIYFETLSAMTLSEVSGAILLLSNDEGDEMVFQAQQE